MYKRQTLLIASKHEKEKVITPILEKVLGVKCIVAKNFDTDELGTFTGEIERTDDPITTVRKKCQLAMEVSNCDMAIASEGSFGPHPSVFFVSADDEFLIFIDKKNGLEIIARELSTETNFNGLEIGSEKELLDFANDSKFPSHGLILRKSKDSKEDIFKGIATTKKLIEAFNNLIDKHGKAYVETDMRAMYNPTRMKVIEKATEKLVEKIGSECPKCKMPGYSVTDSKSGLLCENCGTPTRSTLAHILSCRSCSFTEEKLYPFGKKLEGPTFCDFCNP